MIMKMRIFNLNNFADEIKKALGTEQSKEDVKSDVQNYIFPRIEMFKDRAGYFMIEQEYVESEWKDMISVHYINTSYHVKNSVMRVHLFLGNKIEQHSYLGFFTLRNIDEIRYMLSYIYPNWKNLNLECNTYIMTYQKVVHILGREIYYSTYPLLVQDNMVISCAQAAILSFANYLHNRYDFSKLKLAEINTDYFYARKRAFPSKGLDALQMLEILSNNHIGVDYNAVWSKGQSNNYKQIQGYIECSLESALPVLLGVVFEDSETVIRHVVQIVGHVGEGKGKKYIILDDSGKLILKLTKKHGFCAIVSWEDITGVMRGESNFIIYPMFERVYILYDDVKKIYDDLEKHDQFKKIFQEINIQKEDSRIFLADNFIIKKYLAEGSGIGIGIGIEANLPHYMWCIELKVEERLYLYFILDPTLHADTTQSVVRYVFLSNERIAMLTSVS